MKKITLGCLVVLVSMPSAVLAFERIAEKETFVSLVENRDLKRFGIRLSVSQDGGIIGRAFGQKVTGQWEWSDDGYFCRDLSYGSQVLDPNCQMVEINGKTMRFTSDQGAGMSAKLTLD